MHQKCTKPRFYALLRVFLSNIFHIIYSIFLLCLTTRKEVVEIKVRDEGVDKYSTLFMELAKWKEMDAIIKSKQADQGMYVNFIGDKCYIFCFSQIHPSKGCKLKEVYANRHTATNDGKRWK